MTRPATRQRDGKIVPAYLHAKPRLRASDFQRPEPVKPGLLQRIFGRAST